MGKHYVEVLALHKTDPNKRASRRFEKFQFINNVIPHIFAYEAGDDKYSLFSDK